MNKIFRKFQKLSLLCTLGLSLFALCVVGQGNAKNRAAAFFPRGSGVILNMAPGELDKLMETDSNLLFFYVFNSEQEKSD